MTFEATAFYDWNPADYLTDYYAYVQKDEQHTLKFLVREFKKITGQPVALEFGIGPTLHHVLPLSPHVREIHVTDYLPANLNEIRKWQAEDTSAHNWRAFTEVVLNLEGFSVPTLQDIYQREALTRQRITQHFIGDAACSHPISAEGKYEVVLSCYCADSATDDKATWGRYMRNILSFLRPGGFFITAALRNCSHYKVGDKYFPSANVNEADFEDLFQRLDFDMSRTTIEVQYVPEHKDAGFESIVLASGFTVRRRGSRRAVETTKSPALRIHPDTLSPYTA